MFNKKIKEKFTLQKIRDRRKELGFNDLDKCGYFVLYHNKTYERAFTRTDLINILHNTKKRNNIWYIFDYRDKILLDSDIIIEGEEKI